MKAQKIMLAKAEGLKDALGYLAAEDARRVVFVIAKGSPFADEPKAFVKLQTVAETLGKELAIESVDDEVVNHAQAAGIEASNPFFDQQGSETPQWEEPTLEESDELDAGSAGEEETMPPVVATPVVHKIRRAGRPAPKPLYRRVADDDDDDDEFAVKRGRGLFRNMWVWIGVLIILTAPLYVLGFRVLPRAEIKITTEKKPWHFNNIVVIEKNGPVPSRFLTEIKNAQMAFTATGMKNVTQKTRGMITVYNVYSSKPQQLVATTRFATPEGLIVRLTKNITIPGAKIENSTITPSSIEAEVLADKPGAAHNLSAGTRLTIPGFKGTPRFDGFYGEVKAALSGGFTGESAYPTDDDIKTAKEKIANVLKESLEAQLAGKFSSEYAAVKGAHQFTLTKADVQAQVNAKGEFSVFAEGKLTALAFKESDLTAYLSQKMKQEFGSEYIFKETALSYDIPRIDFAAQKMSLPVDLKATAEQPIDLEALRGKVAGATEAGLKEVLFAVPGVQSAEVTFWPGYVGRVPADVSAAKLTFVVQ